MNSAQELLRRRAHSVSRLSRLTWAFIPRSGGGTFLVEPGAQTGIHHHGAQETVAYVLAGESFIQWGERGEHSLTARAGDFLHVPAWLVHREINRSKDTPFRWVVIRSTSEPIVVNLPPDTWE